MTRSATESKNAPRGDAVPEALATAPSSRSGTAARMTQHEPEHGARPLPIATAAPTASDEAERGEVVGGDAGAAEAGADGLQAAAPRWSASVRRTCECAPGSGAATCRLPARSDGCTRVVTTLVLDRLAGPDTASEGASVKSFPPDKIRNVALVGHGGAGKTTLAEALLHRAGAINRLGRVEDGTTVCDFEPEEQKRGHLAVARRWRRSSGRATRST